MLGADGPMDQQPVDQSINRSVVSARFFLRRGVYFMFSFRFLSLWFVFDPGSGTFGS